MGNNYEYIHQASDEKLADMLEEMNKWRRGEPPYDDPFVEMKYDVKEYGIMLDVAVNRLRTYGIIIKDLREQLEALKPKEFCHENFE